MASTVFPYCTTGSNNLEGTNYPDEGLIISPMFKTTIVEAVSGVEQRRALVSSPRHEFAYKWTHQSNDKSILKTLYEFYVARKGKYESFGLFHFDVSAQWSGLSVGTYVSGTDPFDLNGYNTTNRTIYVNGTLEDASHYTISAGAGTNGRDRLTPKTSPAFTAGAITEAFTGQRWFVVRFKEDKMSMSIFSAKLYDTGLELVEVVGET